MERQLQQNKTGTEFDFFFNFSGKYGSDYVSHLVTPRSGFKMVQVTACRLEKQPSGLHEAATPCPR